MRTTSSFLIYIWELIYGKFNPLLYTSNIFREMTYGLIVRKGLLFINTLTNSTFDLTNEKVACSKNELFLFLNTFLTPIRLDS